jgi:hypothetical protein
VTNVLTVKTCDIAPRGSEQEKMIQLKCAELLFLIGVVTCGVVGNSVDYFTKNNKPFFVVRADDDFIHGNGNGGSTRSDERFMFTTNRC